VSDYFLFASRRRFNYREHIDRVLGAVHCRCIVAARFFALRTGSSATAENNNRGTHAYTQDYRLKRSAVGHGA
jgi:hypothetical protein